MRIIGKSKPAMFWIALASYLSFYPTMLLPALLLVLGDKKVKKKKKKKLLRIDELSS
ncbi:MAG: hypothetical protein JSY10_17705 [Paenibacillus sp.]|nr:hypothetical protein [Paenibacillus sp.]